MTAGSRGTMKSQDNIKGNDPPKSRLTPFPDVFHTSISSESKKKSKKKS